MPKTFPIFGKLSSLVIISVLLTAFALGWVAINTSSKSLEEVEVKALEGVSLSRRDALLNYLESIEQDISTVVTNPYTSEALLAFSEGWDELGSGQENKLQTLYIEDNPNPLGQKENLDYANDGSAYSEAHKTYHSWFRQFLRARGYYDIFLIRNDGELIYSVFKELDYATNLATGKYASSDLGNAYSAAMNADKGQLSFFDFKPYAPSHGAAASFISTPLFDSDGTRIGALVFQMPIDRINATLQSSAGLGETGESYLVGSDGYLRSQAPRSTSDTILRAKISDGMLAGAADDHAGVYEGISYKGEEIVSATSHLGFSGVDWYVVAEIEKQELLAPMRATQSQIYIWGAGLLLFATLLSGFFSHLIARPIKNIASSTRKIIDGNFDIVVPHQDSNDELGPLAQAIEKFRTETIRFTEEFKANHKVAEDAREAAERRAASGEQLINSAHRFDEIMSKTLESFSDATRNLDEQANSMSAIAEETASQSSEISNASATASNNVRNVAAATEELSVSVQEISGKMEISQGATRRAVEQSEVMRDRVSGMETAANAISEVLELITGIASQTNLLALNATIEAARAGEAGKGFAVVASEVKELANQTSKATDDISRQITQIQETTASSVEGIADIMTVIGELEAISSEVANSIEQQSQATTQISQSIQEAAGSVSEVDGNIGGVTEAAGETGKTATQIQSASSSLSEQSALLKNEVESFLKEVRAS